MIDWFRETAIGMDPAEVGVALLTFIVGGFVGVYGGWFVARASLRRVERERDVAIEHGERARTQLRRVLGDDRQTIARRVGP